MSSAIISVPAGPAAGPKPPKKAKRKSVSDLILKAVAASSERGGLSLAGLKKALSAGGYNVVKNNSRILAAVKRLVAKKLLVQTKGSFKLSKKPVKPKKRVLKKKGPKAKKAKKAAAKKKAGASPAKKSPAKKRKAKSPKKAKKAKKATAAKKAKSPKKRVVKKKAPKKSLKKSPKKVKRSGSRAAAAKK